MIADYKGAEIEYIDEFNIVFEYSDGGGYSFPCDRKGTPLTMTAAAAMNLIWCREHPEKFATGERIVKTTRKIKHNPTGTCRCGRRVELHDQYWGACQCECGQWYNIFGQELLPPNRWGQ